MRKNERTEFFALVARLIQKGPIQVVLRTRVEASRFGIEVKKALPEVEESPSHMGWWFLNFWLEEHENSTLEVKVFNTRAELIQALREIDTE